MSGTHLNENEQSALLWNGRAGQAWVDGQALVDAMFEPFADTLVSAVRAASATRVLDTFSPPRGDYLAIDQKVLHGAL